MARILTRDAGTAQRWQCCPGHYSAFHINTTGEQAIKAVVEHHRSAHERSRRARRAEGLERERNPPTDCFAAPRWRDDYNNRASAQQLGGHHTGRI